MMYVCIVDSEGQVLLHRNMTAGPEPFLQAIAPFREDLVVAVECIFTWYWLADLCAEQGIPFVLGHALYMKAIHGGKAKNDRIDSQKIAGLVRSGMIPMAYVYPAKMRATCDLLRRRMTLMRRRAGKPARFDWGAAPLQQIGTNEERGRCCPSREPGPNWRPSPMVSPTREWVTTWARMSF
jgi:hypothetical protein